MACSLVVDTENDARAEKRSVRVGIWRIVIVRLVPQALASDANTLAEDLTDDALDDDLVAWNVQLLCVIFDINDDAFGDVLMFLLIEFLTFQLILNAGLNDLTHLRGIETLVLTRLHSVCWEMRHARVAKIDHFLFLF